LPAGFGSGIQGGKFLMAQIDLTADFDDLGPPGPRQPFRNVSKGLEVLGNVFPHPTVAPGRALHQNPFFITN